MPSVYTPSVELRDINKQSYEGTGIIPDEVVEYDEDAIKARRDPQLAKAISVIKQSDVDI